MEGGARHVGRADPGVPSRRQFRSQRGQRDEGAHLVKPLGLKAVGDPPPAPPPPPPRESSKWAASGDRTARQRAQVAPRLAIHLAPPRPTSHSIARKHNAARLPSWEAAFPLAIESQPWWLVVGWLVRR